MSDMQKTMLITGAAGGVGRATVKHFHERGFRVIGVDRQSVYAEFPTDGLFIQADISVPENLEKIFAQATEFTPTLDVLVNNAGFQVTKPLVETTVEEWDMVSGFQPALGFPGSQAGLSAAKSGRWRSDRERFISARRGYQRQYRCLCRQQRRIARPDPRHGNRVRAG